MAAQRLCRPPVPTQWQQEQVPGGAIVLLRIDRGGEVHSLNDGRILVRKGAENAQADGAELDRLLAARPTGDFETQPVVGATRDDLDEDVIVDYLEKPPGAQSPPHHSAQGQAAAADRRAERRSHADGQRHAALWQGTAAFLAAKPGHLCEICRHRPARPRRLLWLRPPRGVYRPAARHHRPCLARDLGRDGQAFRRARPAAPGGDRVSLLGRARGAGQRRRPPRLPADRAQHRDPHVHRPHGDHQPRRPAGAHHGGQHRRGALQPQPAPRQRPLPVGLHRGVGPGRRPHDRGHGQGRPSTARLRCQDPPLHRHALQHARPGALAPLGQPGKAT